MQKYKLNKVTSTKQPRIINISWRFQSLYPTKVFIRIPLHLNEIIIASEIQMKSYINPIGNYSEIRWYCMNLVANKWPLNFPPTINKIQDILS